MADKESSVMYSEHESHQRKPHAARGSILPREAFDCQNFSRSALTLHAALSRCGITLTSDSVTRLQCFILQVTACIFS